MTSRTWDRWAVIARSTSPAARAMGEGSAPWLAGRFADPLVRRSAEVSLDAILPDVTTYATRAQAREAADRIRKPLDKWGSRVTAVAVRVRLTIAVKS